MALSGYEMLRLYIRAGWVVLRQNGSHVIVGKNGNIQVIPMHRELKKGMERGLLKYLRRMQ